MAVIMNCNAMQFRDSQMFLRNRSSPSSKLESKQMKKLDENGVYIPPKRLVRPELYSVAEQNTALFIITPVSTSYRL